MNGSNVSDYVLFKDLLEHNLDARSLAITLGCTVYNFFFYFSIFLFAYKLAQAIYMYWTRSVHAIQKVQMFNEILEPFKGLIFLIAGGSVIGIVGNFFFGLPLIKIF